MNKIYALYKGDEYLGMGTIKELAKIHGVKHRTIRFYLTPTYKKRCGSSKKRLVLVEV